MIAGDGTAVEILGPITTCRPAIGIWSSDAVCACADRACANGVSVFGECQNRER